MATFTVHSQVTFMAPWPRKTVTTCRQAAMYSAGLLCVSPHEYQEPFISGAKPRITGRWYPATARA